MGTALALLLLIACPAQHRQNADLVYQLDSEVIALKQRIQWLEQHQGGADAGRPAPIYAELVQVIPPEQARVTRDGATTLLSVPASALFSPGSLALRDESAMLLDLLATALNLHPEQPVQVLGYSDDAPIPSGQRRCYPSPWELAAVRAGAVAAELVRAHGVAPERLLIASRGPMDPVAENDTPEGRDANRRIVFRILPAPPKGEDAINWQ